MILSAVLIAVVCADKIRTLDYGTWMGTRSLQRSTITFYNIPYAAPPLGPLRFRPPQPPLNVSLLGILDATQSGPACMVNQKDIINAFAKTSEDCLGLNVIIPARRAKPGANLPVFVYVYGGKFTDGYDTFPYARGSRNIINAGNDVVMVEMNYRVGVFGFLPSPELKDPSNGALNIGILDVAAAFKWVRKHIYAFGGDPNRVTGFGLSSGGFILTSLLMSENGKLDLFDRVFLQSGSLIPVIDTPANADFVYRNLLSHVGRRCGIAQTSLECLRDLPANDLLEASLLTKKEINSPISTAFGPLLDGKIFQRQQHESLRLKLFRKIPMMINTVQDEGVFLTSKIASKEVSEVDFRRRVIPFLNQTDWLEVNKLYPADDSYIPLHNLSQARIWLIKAVTDFYFQCPSRKIAEAYQQAGLPVTKSYLEYELGIYKLFGVKGVVHGSDLALWWQFHLFLYFFSGETTLSKTLLGALMDFGACRDPQECKIGGKSHSIEWPRYENGRINLMNPVTKFSIQPDTQFDPQCAMWDRIVASKGVGIVGQAPISF